MNLNTAGIYKITNNINGKVYIGQSLSIKNRWYSHKSAAKNNNPTLLYRAMRKYGIDNFSIDVIHPLDKNNNLFIEEDLNYFEKFYIAKYCSADISNGYNLTEGGNFGNLNKDVKKHAIARLKVVQRKRSLELANGRLFFIDKYDKTKRGWVTTAARETGLAATSIRLSCDILGIPYRTRKNYIHSKEDFTKIKTIIEKYNTSSPSWALLAVRETGLSSSSLYRLCTKLGISCFGRGNVMNSALLYRDYLLNVEKKPGWIAKAGRELGLSAPTITRYCKTLSIDYPKKSKDKANE